MNKKNIKILTIIAFALIPVVALIGCFYDAPVLSYGKKELTLNSLFLLIFGIYAVFVCALHFIQLHKSWEENNPNWIKEMKLARLFTVLFAISIAFIVICGMSHKDDFKTLFYIERLPFFLFFLSPSFLFLPGIVLSILAYKTYVKITKQKFYSKKTTLSRVIFIIIITLSILFISINYLLLLPLFILAGGIALAVLIILVFSSYIFRKIKPGSYLKETTLTAILFILGGGSSFLIVLITWLMGELPSP